MCNTPNISERVKEMWACECVVARTQTPQTRRTAARQPENEGQGLECGGKCVVAKCGACKCECNDVGQGGVFVSTPPGFGGLARKMHVPHVSCLGDCVCPSFHLRRDLS